MDTYLLIDRLKNAVWEGRGGMGKKKGKKEEKQRKRVSAESICIAVFRRIHQQKIVVGYSAWNKIHVITPLQLSKKVSHRRRYRRYIPTEVVRRQIPAVSPTELFHR